MITGDHALTAGAIATQLGLGASGVITGAELDATVDEALPDLVGTTDVFARASPEHKLKLVGRSSAAVRSRR
jgi:magnesium-transporting ATPase (P-type)